MKTLRLLLVSAALVVLASPASAGLVGATVTGTLKFGANPTNYFDFTNGYVPAGFLNSNPNGITVTIGAGSEFGYNDGFSSIVANFSDTQLVITDILGSSSAGAWTMTFYSTEFSSFSISGSPTLVPITLNLPSTGPLMTVIWGGAPTSNGIQAPGTYSATINISVPDAGSTALLLGLVLVAFALATRSLRPKPARVLVRR